MKTLNAWTAQPRYVVEVGFISVTTGLDRVVARLPANTMLWAELLLDRADEYLTDCPEDCRDSFARIEHCQPTLQLNRR